MTALRECRRFWRRFASTGVSQRVHAERIELAMKFDDAMLRARMIAGRSAVPAVRFLTPIDSVTLAALAVTNGSLKDVLSFSRDAGNYAEINGLSAHLNGDYRAPQGTGLQGRRYSALTRLHCHEEVGDCNRVIADLIFEQLSGYPQKVLSQIVRVVGELHDNVASHSNGTGFSSAQVYRCRSSSRLEIAVADNGIGIPYNVRKLQNGVSDAQCLEWAIKRGNTTAGQNNDWAQRLPADSIVSPFPRNVCTKVGENNHLGLGLWQLSEVVRTLQGELRIASGNGELSQKAASISARDTSYGWIGVVIFVSLQVQDVPIIDQADRAKLDALADRLQVFQ